MTSGGYIKFNWISKEIIGTPLSHRISIIDAFEYSGKRKENKRKRKIKIKRKKNEKEKRKEKEKR